MTHCPIMCDKIRVFPKVKNYKPVLENMFTITLFRLDFFAVIENKCALITVRNTANN